MSEVNEASPASGAGDLQINYRGKDMNWIAVSERLPEVKADDHRQVIVACHRKHNGKTAVFAADYLNEKLLFTDDMNEPEDGTPFTGWYTQTRDDTDYDTAFELVCSEGDEVTHWMPLPAPPAGA